MLIHFGVEQLIFIFWTCIFIHLPSKVCKNLSKVCFFIYWILLQISLGLWVRAHLSITGWIRMEKLCSQSGSGQPWPGDKTQQQNISWKKSLRSSQPSFAGRNRRFELLRIRQLRTSPLPVSKREESQS